MDMKVLSRDARSCTLGIIGMGNIGKMGETVQRHEEGRRNGFPNRRSFIRNTVANHLQHFGMKVVYSKRTPLPADGEWVVSSNNSQTQLISRPLKITEENGCRFVSLDELFQVSDVVCVMCPLTPETKHLLSAKGEVIYLTSL